VASSLVDNIPDVGVLRMLGNQCSTRYHFQMWSLGAFEMQVRAEGTLELFQKMQHKGVQSNLLPFVGCCIHACIVMLEDDRCPHEQIIQIGWDSDVFVGSSLVDMYAKCGSV